MEESKFSPYNKYKSHITSSKIKIHHLLYSNDGSLSVPLPFHHYNQALWSLIKNLAYNSGSLEQSAFRHSFFPFISQQVFLSFIYLNFVPILSFYSLSTFWGDLHVGFGLCDASSIQITQLKLSSLTLSTPISLL